MGVMTQSKNTIRLARRWSEGCAITAKMPTTKLLDRFNKIGQSKNTRKIKMLMMGNMILALSVIALTCFLLKDRGKEIVTTLGKEIVTTLLTTQFKDNRSKLHFYSQNASVDLDSLCTNIETHTTVNIEVWKHTVSAGKAQYLLPSDMDIAYHAVMVYETQDPMGVRHYWSQEKQRTELVFQHSTNKDDVVKKMNGRKRIGEGAWQTDPKLLLRDFSAVGIVPKYFILSERETNSREALQLPSFLQ
ncbi:uncharacterized protein LOC134820712 [Bolinopsis microptera]|uniref:uncharacterized protein LOC134820712 n=1 Tax=Bolinopsis microptera TaxID=2820187 RepID=UPI00307AC060